MERIKWLQLILCFTGVLQVSAQGGLAPSRFLVQFTDKNGTPHSISNPSTFLSGRAVSRRATQGIAINFQDLPPTPSYLDSITARGAQILNVSKWLNAVCIFSNDSNVVAGIQNLPFVSGVMPLRMPAHAQGTSKLDFTSSPLASRKIIYPVDSFPRSLNYGASQGQISMLNLESLHIQGYQGQGMLIAVLDAGFLNANALPAFDSLFATNRILMTHDFVDGGANVYDDHNHGMNVLSVLGGNIPGSLIGSAPQASFILLRTEDAATEYLIEEFNWVVGAEFADSAGADIISSSLGYTTFDNPAMDHVYSDLNGLTAIGTKGATWAAARGILVVNSAGNSGGSPWNYIGVPADADSILATGAVDSMENLAGFSSRGPSADGRIKPDVSAQGADVVMSSSSGAIMTGNGTSFSCPLISGAAACLWQANPGLNAMQIRDAIIQSADQYLNPDNNKGYGIPDFGQALFVLNGKRLDKPSGNTILSCYPNPADDLLNLALFSKQTQEIQIFLCDMSGRLIDEILTGSRAEGYHHFRVDMRDLSPGLYLLKIQFPDSAQVLKIVRR